MPPPVVCLLDGESPPAIAALRLLAQRDVQVVVGHSETADPDHLQRIGPCAHTHAYPDPHSPVADLEWELLAWLARERPDVVLPLGLTTSLALCRHTESLAEKGIIAPIPTERQMTLATDRAALWREAREIGLATPQIATPAPGDNIPALVSKFARPPAVIPRMMTRTERAVCPATHEEAIEQFRALEKRTGDTPLLLEPLPPGGGWLAVTALCDIPGGVMVRVTEHWTGWDRAPRQPRWRAITDHRDAVAQALHLLVGLAWEGAATVQFALDLRDGAPKLLQLWPGLGADLALASAAGIDLAWPLVEWAMEHTPTQPRSCRTDLHTDWQPDGAPWIFAPRHDSPESADSSRPTGEFIESVIR